MRTKPTGSDPATARPAPSTLGGPGWLPRTASHAEEVRRGQLWRPCGYRSEVDSLRTVLLGWPPDSLGTIRDPAAQLMSDRVDLPALRRQTERLESVYREHGVRVVTARPAGMVPPNFLFMRDLFFMTPEGAVVGRMASTQRAGEERYAARALAGPGYPILATVAGTATFEGADALWLDRHTVLVATGFRTNAAGADVVRRVLAEQGVRVVTTRLGAGVQHLLGMLTPLDERLAALHGGAATDELRTLLRAHDYRVIELPPDEELCSARGMNLVALAPGRVLMPTGAPTMRRRFASAGVTVEEVEVSEYVKAAGGLGCITGIVWRAEHTEGIGMNGAHDSQH
jgi:N-dimethylarginine dimethylaminohydrolase